MTLNTNYLQVDWNSWTPAFEDTQLQAYFLWENEGKPYGGADDFYFRAESLLKTIYRCEGFAKYLKYIYQLRGHNV